MPRMSYAGPPIENFAEPRVYNAGSMRDQLRSAVQGAWNSTEGTALRQQLRASVPRAEMSRRMAPLAGPISGALRPLGPMISQAYRAAWGSY